MNLKLDKRHNIFIFLLSLGIMLRYLVMSLGYNYDFTSYCIVGEISGNLRNVYAETTRYNYGPIFLCIQGLLYRISQIKPDNWMLIYRVMIVTVLTMADLGIAAFIANRHSYFKALVFFLNPVSIIITGFHNQFDNIAVMLALISTLFFNKEEKLNKKDFWFIVFISLSLITKHILFILPLFILLMKDIPLVKRLLYAFLPPVIFLVSFIPFAMSSDEAFWGIVNNVFRYRSLNNMPIMQFLFVFLPSLSIPLFIIYLILMLIVALLVKKMKYESIICIYLISMVAFSSAIANQYLAIPMAALCILNVHRWDKIYMVIIGLFLVLEGKELGVLNIIKNVIPGSLIDRFASLYVRDGFIMAAWILFMALAILIYSNKKYGIQLISDQ